MVSPTDTFITAGSNTMVPSTPAFNIFTTCSEPSESSTFGKLLLVLEGADADAAGAEPQSSPSKQIEPTGAILFSIAFFASEAPKVRTKPKDMIKKIFEYFIFLDL